MILRFLPIIALLSATAHALEFRSVEAPAILYDAPSLKAKPLFVIPAGAPVELVVELPNWVKVRDVKGDLAWIEAARLSTRRTVIVKTERAEVRTSPDVKAPVLFVAEMDVWLERLEAGPPGWLKVRHADGETGFVKVSDVWGP
ncbi:MAG: SH3 domain-containing protein [Rhodocyclaceae bacterium]|nr:SH3 domain-containing protein [Rhodocyclaceae bacterium]